MKRITSLHECTKDVDRQDALLRINRYMYNAYILPFVSNGLEANEQYKCSLIPRPLTVVFSGLGMRLISLVKSQKLRAVNLTTRLKKGLCADDGEPAPKRNKLEPHPKARQDRIQALHEVSSS